MAKRKSAEELMLEAELEAAAQQAGSGDAAPQQKSLPDAHRDVPLPDEPVAGKERRKNSSGLKAKIARPRVIAGVAGAVVVVVVVALVVSRVMFANSTDVWDGTADTGWYHDNMTSFTVTTAEQLAGIRELCNSGTDFEGMKFTLGRNLDLRDAKTKPIGDGRQEEGKYHEFRGSFDGAGHTISGLNVQEDTWDHAGLFGVVDDGDICGLTVEGKVTGQVRVGGIVGQMEGGSLTNCTNRCKVSSLKTATSYYPVTADVGGVCGIWLGINEDSEKASIENLINEGEVSARACSAGGVLGTLANSHGFTARVNHLENNGSVTVYCESDSRDEAVGGVIGVVGGSGADVIEGLVNNGDVSCSSVLSVGGVFGAIMAPQREQKSDSSGQLTEGVQVSKCSNTARVASNTADERAHVGGIVGYLDDPGVTFEGCENSGELAPTNGNKDNLFATNGAEVWDEWEDAHPKSNY